MVVLVLSLFASTALAGQEPLCRVDGSIASGGMPLPGVSVFVHVADTLKAATSTDANGRYAVLLESNATYRFSVALTAFTPVAREVMVASGACDSVVDFQLELASRRQSPSVAVSADGVPSAPTDALTAPNLPNRRAVAIAAGRSGATRENQADTSEPQDAGDLERLLPPGFSLQAVQSDAVAIAGRNGAVNMDRAALIDRIQAGPLGRFILGGRAARQSPYQGTTTYGFGGSLLNAAPYQLRRDVPSTQPPFAKNSFGASIGGPLKIPGLHADANGRTNFQLNYAGNRSTNVFDQYATVPTAAMRSGNFSTSSIPLIDPLSGQPFGGNQIPSSRIDPGAASLMTFIPPPNLPGASQNYHVSTTARTSSDSVSVRLTQNLSPLLPTDPAADPGRRRRNILMNGQLQYRRNESESLNVFPGLGGRTTSVSIGAPISLSIVSAGLVQAFTFNISHSNATTTNAFSGVEDVSAEAGINYPGAAALDPLNWGVPALVFSGFTGVKGMPAASRTDSRLSLGYSSSRPLGTHRIVVGGGYRLDAATSESNGNARGTFTFTGLYSSGGSSAAAANGADFADFLLGAAQQATLQVGGVSRLRGHGFDAYIEDNWQRSASLTFNIGLRYELVRPFVETRGRMANLDVAPNFTMAVPVVSAGVGAFTGAFPAGLINTDVNNVGPRLGAAYRAGDRTVLRGGYSVTYNLGSYAAIARQLVAQPPFAETETVIGTSTRPLAFASALLPAVSATTNNFGVDKNYQLGRIQTWNATVTRNLGAGFTAIAGYTGVKGTDLDIMRAPNRGPAGLRIPGVQAFTWQSSGGRSIMHAGNVQLVRRRVHGVGGSVSYTLARSMDNASSLGAGIPVVAQNDQDLDAEWGLSNFDRRHQLTGNLVVQLPFGADQPWLNNGGIAARLFGDWSVSLAFAAQSGTPYTVRVIGEVNDVLRGTNGSLRADCTGSPVQRGNPTIDEFFNTAAFSLPVAGTYGNCGRNTVIGPGGHQLNGSLVRDLRLGGNRTISLQLNAANLLNTVQWAGIDTNLNSLTFGQITSVRPMKSVTFTGRFRF